MTIAIDKSGSTFGKTLEAEIEAVREICRLRLPSNKRPIPLLPWCNFALEPILLPDNNAGMMALSSRGGTNPSVLYSSGRCLEALKACGVWFLMTDGQIHDSLVESFALHTAKVKLHNKPCVIIIFDHASFGRPADCNISVGIATFAVVPDCLVLFHDLSTGHVRAMQAKGRFKELLPTDGDGHVQPVVTKFTVWEELPRISYEDLARIQLAPVRELETDEVQLQGGLVVNLPDILSGKADPKTVEQIMKNDDDLKSIVLASMTRGTGKEVNNWLQAQQMPLPEMKVHPDDTGGKAQAVVDRLLAAIAGNQPEALLDPLRVAVREAHKANLDAFRHNVRRQKEIEKPRRLQNLQSRQAARMYSAKRKDVWSYESQCAQALRVDDDVEVNLRRERDAMDSLEPICLSGFRRHRPVEEFKGRCMLCHSTSVLTLLFKAPPAFSTGNFPREGSYSKTAFPLAMGSFAEVDVLSFFVCCDACAGPIQRGGKCPNPNETIIGAACLVNIRQNQATWLQVLDLAMKGRFHVSDLLATFVAVVDRKLVENEQRAVSIDDKTLFRDCAQWTLLHLAQMTEVPFSLSFMFAEGGKYPEKRVNLRGLLSTEFFMSPGQVDNLDLLLLRYPIPGFLVLLRLSRLLFGHPGPIQSLLFQRVIFHVIEQYMAAHRSGTLQLPVEEILGNNSDNISCTETGSSMTSGGKTSIAITDLISYGLLDQANLDALRGQSEFQDVEAQCGPALAVFLHHLLQYARLYPTEVACFNALKANAATKRVILTPLAISAALAVDLISQL
jgi:hypothetical protein